MADYDLKAISPDTDGPTADTAILFGAEDQSSATPKPFSFAGIKIWIKAFLAGQVPATATNDSATAGNVGEYGSAVTLRGANTSLVTGTPKTVVSVSLAAGDYDVWGLGGFSNGTSATSMFVGVSLTTNTLPGLDSGQEARVSGPTFTGDTTLPAPQTRISFSATTTVYLVVQATFTGTTTVYGTINWRRRR